MIIYDHGHMGYEIWDIYMTMMRHGCPTKTGGKNSFCLELKKGQAEEAGPSNPDMIVLGMTWTPLN